MKQMTSCRTKLSKTETAISFTGGSIVWDEDNDVRVAAMATALKQLDDLFDPSDAKTTDYGYKMFRMDL